MYQKAIQAYLIESIKLKICGSEHPMLLSTKQLDFMELEYDRLIGNYWHWPFVTNIGGTVIYEKKLKENNCYLTVKALEHIFSVNWSKLVVSFKLVD